MTRVDLELLAKELTAAGVPFNGLTSTEHTTETVFTYDHGDPIQAIIPLPPEADPVLAAHTAPPQVVEYAGTQEVSSVLRTTDDQPAEVFRFPTAPRHVYRATFSIAAIDANSGAIKDSEARMTFKRTASAVVQAGSTAILYNAADAAASSWAIQPGVSGTDFTISVKGALGRTIDWLLVGTIAQFAPAGI